MNTPAPCCNCRKSFYNVMTEDDPYSSGWCDVSHEEFWGDKDCPFFAEGDIDFEANALERAKMGKSSLLAMNKIMETCHWINVFQQVEPGSNLDKYFKVG